MEPLAEDSSRHWAEPGVYTVAPGVYRIPLPLPHDALRAVNVYAIVEGDSLALIDSGWALTEAREQLAAGLKALGAELGDVGQFLVTHVHRDHYTMAVALRREFGGTIGLGEHEAESLRLAGGPGVTPVRAQLRSLHRAGAEPLVNELVESFGGGERRRTKEDLWEEPDVWLTPGRRTVLPGRQLEVVHTPGHTAGHVVFDDAAAGLLFTGDHVLPHITPSIGFQPAPFELPLKRYLGSLRLVRSMPDRRMLPAHGAVSPSVHARVDELLAHHDRRLAETGETIARGATTAYEAALRLTWTRRERTLADLDVFNRMLAVLETAAHLDLLVTQGRLTATETGDVRHYALP
ncbi:glyoxylase-like metal-dependent hydrolase (beta-lactamase superfamily II) [Prauserella shujinwangii]|uniref:Glyoxylase-like metal-dependent hydrolase (Beta-lactamase superfamily II) n=1 Tax=Prauserella shujinwangii TaxID=1453103 RepID=A0A2T0LWC7_9PSEU|nr:MBL fold metallo-hydrolase [Prauserella shujinwangii]PRX48269.1 glyoxylase-like metal-dependent hydrolase (beta-lactamase superfamily II) [Prauserella shujinwangii]